MRHGCDQSCSACSRSSRSACCRYAAAMPTSVLRVTSSVVSAACSVQSRCSARRRVWFGSRASEVTRGCAICCRWLIAANLSAPKKCPDAAGRPHQDQDHSPQPGGISRAHRQRSLFVVAPNGYFPLPPALPPPAPPPAAPPAPDAPPPDAEPVVPLTSFDAPAAFECPFIMFIEL